MLFWENVKITAVYMHLVCRRVLPVQLPGNLEDFANLASNPILVMPGDMSFDINDVALHCHNLEFIHKCTLPAAVYVVF